jgi:hypothetical protein
MDTTEAVKLVQISADLVSMLPQMVKFVAKNTQLTRTAPGFYTCGSCKRVHADHLCMKIGEKEFCGPCVLEAVKKTYARDNNAHLPIDVAPKARLNRHAIEAILNSAPDGVVTFSQVEDTLMQAKASGKTATQLLANQFTQLKSRITPLLQVGPTEDPNASLLLLADGLLSLLLDH